MNAPAPAPEGISTLTSREEFIALLACAADSGRASNFFLSPAWARRYLGQWPADDFFLGMRLPAAAARTASDAGSLFCLSRGVRSSPLSAGHRSLGFNESSSAGLQDVTTEINGLIGNGGLGLEDWFPAILHRLMAVEGWDELRINALSNREAACLNRDARQLGLICHDFSRSLRYWIDLDQIRSQYGGSYLASRSANTRQQLRRALKGLRKTRGEIELTSASSTAQAHLWLEALAALHKKRWNAHGELKGFANPHFCRFHHELLDCMLASGEIEILCARAGGEALAFLYNYVADGHVYFSMSGVDHERFADYKPGILAHSQAIEHYLAKGLRIYDFQMGTSQYKQSLASDREERVGVVVRKPLLRFRVEAAARWAKRRFQDIGRSTSLEGSA